jgi:DNA-binding Lrp family transcriptional regulator
MKLDRTDLALLALLQKDAGLSNKELARKVNLAASSCLERVKKLRQAGVVRGFHAEVDPRALGIGIQALIAVRLARHSEREVCAYRDSLLARAEVLNFFHLSGAVDFLVHVAVRDVEHLRAFGAEAFTSHKLVSHVETSLIFDHRRSPVLPAFVRAAPEEGAS